MALEVIVLINKKQNFVDQSSLVEQIVFAFWLTVLIVFARGYSFPGANHGQEIPPILAMLNPDLYRNDFAIQSYLAPGVRYYYQCLIVFLVGAVGLSFPIAYFSLYFASLFSFVLATQKIALHVATLANVNDRRIAYLAAGTLVYWCQLQLNSWGSELFQNAAIPSGFAMGIAVWGLYGAVKRRWILAYWTFGVAAMLQFLIGLLPGLIVMVAFVIDISRTRRWGVGVIALFLWIVGLAIVYVPIVLFAMPAPVDFNFFESFGLYRVPHHWSPSMGWSAGWVSDVLLGFSVIALAWTLYQEEGDETVQQFAILVGTSVVMAILAVLLNYLCVDVWQVTLIGKLQFQRTIPFAHYFAFLMLLLYLVRVMCNRQFVLAVALVVAPLTIGFGLVVAALGLTVVRKITDKNQIIVIGAGFLAYPFLEFVISRSHTTTFGLMTYGPVSFIQATLIFLIILWIFMLIGMASFRKLFLVCSSLLSLTLFVFMVSSSFQLFVVRMLPNTVSEKEVLSMVQTRWALDRSEKLPGYLLAKYFESHSDINDVVLLPPTWEEFTEMFQLLSKRAAYFDHKNIPFDDYHVWIWAERAKKLLGIDKLKPFMSNEERTSLFRSRSSADIERLARENKICFVVSRDNWHDFSGEIVAAESAGNQNWVLWKLNNCKS